MPPLSSLDTCYSGSLWLTFLSYFPVLSQCVLGYLPNKPSGLLRDLLKQPVMALVQHLCLNAALVPYSSRIISFHHTLFKFPRHRSSKLISPNHAVFKGDQHGHRWPATLVQITAPVQLLLARRRELCQFTAL